MVQTQSVKDLFGITVTDDKMEAFVEIKSDIEKMETTKTEVIQLLEESKIYYGRIDENLNQIVDSPYSVNFPCLIARGLPAEQGRDGKLEFMVNLQSDLTIKEKEELDFREVIKIPTVSSGDSILKVIPKEEGKSGMNVLGEEIKPEPVQEARINPGQNTKWKTDDTIIATMDGQVSQSGNKIHVLPTYEVDHSVDMRSGNVDFNGSVIIRGDVPTGFTVKAKGDIHIFGLVEGAHLDAGGSIFIQKGISAMYKGMIHSGLDVHAKYVNQGKIEAGRDIFVEESIMLSECIAREKVFCQKGSLIGGHISAGQQIYVKDLGNRLNAETSVYLGEDKKSLEGISHLEERLKELYDSINKLKQLGEKIKKIESVKGTLTPKEKTTRLKQQNSLRLLAAEYKEVQEAYQDKTEKNVDFVQPALYVRDILYPNTKVNFGKYQKGFLHQHQNVHVKLNDYEIEVLPFK
ncbi:hypothetical protein SAMN05421676_104327 [Salinibacillus kushneri]|uniref:Flagellar Assembly Protein A N-terminal region domain-containing protein n=1 Tax=Salinibacillus kushneri TaxID=237682 RepID=A0A1I0E7J6_9BACI|nr:FapA family protein [Salinibacillus kushneri]SET40971.1 hypothetical protein SAMN05421676_104327 [Salinibacillus kushneri]